MTCLMWRPNSFNRRCRKRRRRIRATRISRQSMSFTAKLPPRAQTDMTVTQSTAPSGMTCSTLWTARAIIACGIILYLVLSVGRMLTDAPTCDEGWFASPAHNLITRGVMTTTVIEEANLSMTTGIHTYTYWIMPLNVLMQAAWYKLFGFGLFTMRSISVL